MKGADRPVTPRAGQALIAVVALAAAIAMTGMLAPHRATAISPVRMRLAHAFPPMVRVPVPLPLQMASTGDCEQLVIVTGLKLGARTGTLQIFDKVDDWWLQELDVSARFGKRGLVDGTLRRAGSNTTPTGIWVMPDYVFGTHRRAPSGTKMAYRQMDSRSWWSSKRGPTYNTWVEARHWTGEYIAGSPKAYEFAVSTGYNALPNASVYGRGTAIFLHVMGSGFTAGCVAVSRADMIRICQLLDQSKSPHFVVGTLQGGTPTSIWSY